MTAILYIKQEDKVKNDFAQSFGKLILLNKFVALIERLNTV
jgi:hypothetical protein